MNGCLNYATNKGGNWHSEIVGPASYDFDIESLVLDGSGNAHILYERTNSDYTVDMVYSTNKEGHWVTEIVEGDTHSTVGDLAMDSSGGLHACYFKLVNIDLIYSLRPSGGHWAREVARDGGAASPRGTPYYAIGIAITPSGERYLAYIDDTPNTITVMAISDGTHWSEVFHDNIFNGGGQKIAMVSDSMGHIHIFYDTYFYGTKYATNANGAWVSENVTARICSDLDIAVDSKGEPHLIYSVDSNLLYATKVGGIWKESSIDTTGASGCSIAIGQNDAVHICYVDITYEETSHVEKAY